MAVDRRTRALPLLTLAFAAVVLGALFALFRGEQKSAAALHTHAAAEQAARRLEDFVRVRLLAVGTLAHEQRDTAVELDGFAARAEAVHDEFGGILAINWIRPDGTIEWVVPRSRNARAVGRNVRHHPARAARESFLRAERTGERTVTEPLELLQGGIGIASYFPVRRDGRVAGYLNGVLRAEDVVEEALGASILSSYEARVVARGATLFETPVFAACADRLVSSATLRIDEQEWELLLAPNDALHATLVPPEAALPFVIAFLLAGAFAYALRESLARTAEREHAEKRRSELAQLAEANIDFVGMATPDGRVIYLNRAARELLGVGPDATLRSLRADGYIHAEDRARSRTAFRQAIETGSFEGELRITGAKGDAIPLEVRAFPIRDPASKEIVAVAATARDLREQRRLESELVHAQKMEAIGRLAGGVAHDFNNLLTVILGHAAIARHDPTTAAEHLDGVVRASRRAADLTSKLLAFSRKQVVERRPLDLSARVRELEPMLKRLVRENIALELSLGEVGSLTADASQIEQVVINLVVNAVDAMPEGGRLVVETSQESLATDEDGARWVVLRVVDTGVGMTPEVRAHIFEPFYTTKEAGRGTGLGLATVYGIVEDAGGTIDVESEPGRGTTFTLRFPRTDAVAEVTPSSEENVRGGTERVLLTEDDPEVRAVARSVLEGMGYRVTEARDGREALALLVGQNRGSFDVLVTDVVMPGLSGRALAEAVRSAGNDIAVLLASGYAEGQLDEKELASLGAVFLAKPYTPARLLDAVRRAIERAEARRPAEPRSQLTQS